MSFNDIEPFRKALEGIPDDLIKPSMASLLWVIVSYPNGCYIGQDALAKQARLKHDNFTKVLRACTKLGLINREQTYARTGLRQNYSVNMNRILELGRVEISTPTLDNRVENKAPLGVTDSDTGSTPVDPYKYNKNNKSSRDDLFSNFQLSLPAHKRFSFDLEVSNQLKNLEHRGTTLEAIQDDLRLVAWDSITNPKAFVISRLRDIEARPIRFSADSPPPKCLNPECDQERRTLSKPVEVPLGNGATTIYCLECNHHWVNKRNGY
jgi:hypothetical protein